MTHVNVRRIDGCPAHGVSLSLSLSAQSEASERGENGAPCAKHPAANKWESSYTSVIFFLILCMKNRESVYTESILINPHRSTPIMTLQHLQSDPKKSGRIGKNRSSCSTPLRPRFFWRPASAADRTSIEITLAFSNTRSHQHPLMAAY